VELAQIQAGLDMENEVTQSDNLKTIKTSSLLDNALAVVSKDGRETVVQASATIKAGLMSVTAYHFCAEQKINQILMAENNTSILQVVQHKSDHAFVLHFGIKLPNPLKDRDLVSTFVFQKLEDGGVIISTESSGHDDVPRQEGVVRFHVRRLMRFSPISPTVTRFTVTTVCDFGGSIPRFVSNTLTTPGAARNPFLALRYFNQIKPAETFEAADAKELGQLLVLDMNDVRTKRDKRLLEARLRTFVDRSAVLRGVRAALPWFEVLMFHVLRNELRVPKGSKKALAEFGEEEGKKAGRGLANALIANVSAEAGVDEWMRTYPALGEMELQ
jgi:hypothetical protein